jgi:uncharacterized protein (TIGR00369 family)
MTGTSTDTIPPWREPVRGGYFDEAALRRPGLERLRAMVDGVGPRPPIAHLTGSLLVEAGVGTAVFTQTLSQWLFAPQGAISIGPLAIVADAALGCAIQTGLPAATPFTTSELSLRLLAPVPADGSAVARGRLIHLRRRLALSEVFITDVEGRLLAHGSSLCVVLPTIELGPSEPPAPAPPVAADDTPDPYLREPQGEVVPQEVWDRLSGLEVLRAQLAGELPRPPIERLTGLAPAAASEGEATFTLPASEWLCAPVPGRIQGGAVALIAETALSAAIQTKLPPGTALAPVDLKVNYLRPAASDGRELTAVGRVVHAGRQIAVAGSEVRDADGKPVAVATGSAMLLPGRPASLAGPED